MNLHVGSLSSAGEECSRQELNSETGSRETAQLSSGFRPEILSLHSCGSPSHSLEQPDLPMPRLDFRKQTTSVRAMLGACCRTFCSCTDVLLHPASILEVEKPHPGVPCAVKITLLSPFPQSHDLFMLVSSPG